MSVPKLLSMVFCLRVVPTEPWLNFTGVFTELLQRQSTLPAFDVYVRIGNVDPDRDRVLTIVMVDPVGGVRLHKEAGLSRATHNRMLDRALRFEMEFPREDTYFVEVWLDDMFVDAQELEVYFIG